MTRVSSGDAIPDLEFYTPLFSPWIGFGEFERYFQLAAPFTLVSRDRCWTLYRTALQCTRLGGEYWECGVYKGGTARMLANVLADANRKPTPQLRLFDTFGGMPPTDPLKDHHRQGDFADTQLDWVRQRVGDTESISYHQGIIPETFKGLEDKQIAFAHVDVDVHDSVKDCCDFIFPRLQVGGIMIFDDYGFPSCPGARAAVDEYFSRTPFVPLVLPTGQAVVFKSWA